MLNKAKTLFKQKSNSFFNTNPTFSVVSNYADNLNKLHQTTAFKKMFELNNKVFVRLLILIAALYAIHSVFDTLSSLFVFWMLYYFLVIVFLHFAIVHYIYVYINNELIESNELKKWLYCKKTKKQISNLLSCMFIWSINIAVSISIMHDSKLICQLIIFCTLLVFIYNTINYLEIPLKHNDFFIWSKLIIMIKLSIILLLSLFMMFYFFDLEYLLIPQAVEALFFLICILCFKYNILIDYRKKIEFKYENIVKIIYVISNRCNMFTTTMFEFALMSCIWYYSYVFVLGQNILFTDKLIMVSLLTISVSSSIIWLRSNRIFNNKQIISLLVFGAVIAHILKKIIDFFYIKSNLNTVTYTQKKWLEVFDYNSARKYNKIYIENWNLNFNKNTNRSLNTHFQTYDSSLLATLTVWQYWWWMMFIFVIALFNNLLVRIFLNNTFYVNPKTHTSLKSNGRWGDLVASLFPVFWCTNILINSNYILRVIENQTETGTFTLRVRGKQWYWVYKFSVNVGDDVKQHGLIIGHNKKLPYSYGFHNYKPTVVKHKKIFFQKTKIVNIVNLKYNSTIKQYYNKFNATNRLINHTKFYHPFKYTQLDSPVLTNHIKINAYKSINRLQKKIIYDKYYHRDGYTKLVLNKNPMYSDGSNLFNVRVKHFDWYKQYNRHFFTLQQQPKKHWIVANNKNVIHLLDGSERKKTIIPVNNYLKKKVVNKLRLLSTYNTLVLPTNTNITVITNSFDVVHSWFIPGIGLKFDCVPGRSTHYSLRIDKAGIYYGHCAEVCGRFHHHMPIKIIALPFNQFLYYYDMYYVLAVAK